MRPTRKGFEVLATLEEFREFMEHLDKIGVYDTSVLTFLNAYWDPEKPVEGDQIIVRVPERNALKLFGILGELQSLMDLDLCLTHSRKQPVKERTEGG